MAEHAIDNGFYVVGVVLTQDGVVKHVIATRKTEIQAFRVQNTSRVIVLESIRSVFK